MSRPPRSACPHVLVIDDEESIRHLLAATLRPAGLSVSGAEGTEEALRLASVRRPDIVVADLVLGDGDGLEVVDRLRQALGEVPVVIITGRGDPALLARASRCRPVEVLNKPLDLARLRQVVWAELQRQENYRRFQNRHRRLRELTRRANRQRRTAVRALRRTCAELSVACRTLKTQMDRQQAMLDYQTELLTCTDEDDIFRRLFRLFVQRTGPLFGVALLCDENAELQFVGRFGVPSPDGVTFCRAIADAVTAPMLERPEVTILDAVENLPMFPPDIHRLLVGVTFLAVPLLVGEGQLIGLVVLYRKGEQPFTDDDVALAEMIATPTAMAVQKT